MIRIFLAIGFLVASIEAAVVGITPIFAFEGVLSCVDNRQGLASGVIPVIGAPFSGAFSLDLSAPDIHAPTDTGVYNMLVPPASLRLVVGDNVFEAQSVVLAEVIDNAGFDTFRLSSGFFAAGTLVQAEGSLVLPPDWNLTLSLAFIDPGGAVLDSEALSQPIEPMLFPERTFDLENAREEFQLEGSVSRVWVIPEPSLASLGGIFGLVALRRRRSHRPLVNAVAS